MTQSKIDFKTAYCRVNQCSEEEFSRRVFRRALHLRVRPFAGLLAWMSPRFFRNDHMLIEEVALLSSRSECLEALQGYHQDCRMSGGFLHNECRLRVSGKRLLTVFESTLHRAGVETSSHKKAVAPQDQP